MQICRHGYAKCARLHHVLIFCSIPPRNPVRLNLVRAGAHGISAGRLKGRKKIQCCQAAKHGAQAMPAKRGCANTALSESCVSHAANRYARTCPAMLSDCPKLRACRRCAHQAHDLGPAAGHQMIWQCRHSCAGRGEFQPQSARLCKPASPETTPDAVSGSKRCPDMDAAESQACPMQDSLSAVFLHSQSRAVLPAGMQSRTRRQDAMACRPKLCGAGAQDALQIAFSRNRADAKFCASEMPHSQAPYFARMDP